MVRNELEQARRGMERGTVTEGTLCGMERGAGWGSHAARDEVRGREDGTSEIFLRKRWKDTKKKHVC
jgi:hypothetical protein